jgi:hypothetical protein
MGRGTACGPPTRTRVVPRVESSAGRQVRPRVDPRMGVRRFTRCSAYDGVVQTDGRTDHATGARLHAYGVMAAARSVHLTVGTTVLPRTDVRAGGRAHGARDLRPGAG